MAKLQVAVLRGGPSSHYDFSIKTGGAVLKNMPENFQGHDIFITKDNSWHRDGIPKAPEKALQGIDVIFNGLHGEYGEDGKIQRMLDSFSIPYTGSSAMASAMAMNKEMARNIFEKNNIKSPYHTVIKREDNIAEKTHYVFNHFFLPVIVKPTSSGLSLGVTVVKDFNLLETALENAFHYSSAVIIEEYIRGKEAAVGVIENFRYTPIYTLLPVEIIYPSKDDFYTHTAKQHGLADLNLPGTFSEAEKQELHMLAGRIHELLRLKQYSRTDFIVTPHRGIYVLEVNSQPELSEGSLMVKSLEAIGADLSGFIRHIVGQALEHNNN